MPDNQDPLSQLWQQQEVEEPDLNVIYKAWKIMRLKQKCYALLDVLGLLIPIIILYLYREKLDSFTIMYFGGLTLLLVPFVAYVLWLRRYSISWSSKNTDEYVQGLKTQITNNIRIAYISKLSIWPIGVLIVLHHLGLFYFDVFPMDKLIRKSVISAGLLIVMFPCLWVWASRREVRFKAELVKLEKL